MPNTDKNMLLNYFMFGMYALAPVPVLSRLQHFLDSGSSAKISYLFLPKSCMDIRIFHCISVAELYMNGTDQKQMLSRESIGIWTVYSSVLHWRRHQ